MASTGISGPRKATLLERGYSVTRSQQHMDGLVYKSYYTWTHKNGPRLMAVGGQFRSAIAAWCAASQHEESKITVGKIPGTKMPPWKVELIEAKRIADKSSKINRPLVYGRIVEQYWNDIMNTRQLTPIPPTKRKKP